MASTTIAATDCFFFTMASLLRKLSNKDINMYKNHSHVGAQKSGYSKRTSVINY